MNFAVKGGIGDFLQCLPFMMAHPEHRYFVVSHYGNATAFFAHLDISVNELPLGAVRGVEDCPRQLFFAGNPFPRPQLIFSGKRPVVGIHLGGSDYSLSTEKRFGFPPKAIPTVLLDLLVERSDDTYDFLVFGSPQELDRLGWIDNPRVRMVRSDDITVSLSHVIECTAMIGSDSAFKTMSAMLRIPTIVLMGDYRDDHRDDRFIHPYYMEHVLSYFRYKDLTCEDELDEAVKFCLNRLEAKCSVSQT